MLHSKMLEVESKAENDFIAAQIRSRTGTVSLFQSDSLCVSLSPLV